MAEAAQNPPPPTLASYEERTVLTEGIVKPWQGVCESGTEILQKEFNFENLKTSRCQFRLAC